MRRIEQPGPPVAERIQCVEVRGRAFSFMTQAGIPLLEAARRGFAAEGFAGGVLNFRGGALGPFAYVMPALSKTPDHAAFYSDTFRPAGVTRLKMGAMTLGERDGAPFFHCHALWTEADGRVNGGHILPEETVVAEPFEVDAFGIDGAVEGSREAHAAQLGVRAGQEHHAARLADGAFDDGIEQLELARDRRRDAAMPREVNLVQADAAGRVQTHETALNRKPLEARLVGRDDGGFALRKENDFAVPNQRHVGGQHEGPFVHARAQVHAHPCVCAHFVKSKIQGRSIDITGTTGSRASSHWANTRTVGLHMSELAKCFHSPSFILGTTTPF